jgi:hypothetical protein
MLDNLLKSYNSGGIQQQQQQQQQQNSEKLRLRKISLILLSVFWTPRFR